jgi:hypothetical protein
MQIVKASRDPNIKHAHALYAYLALGLTTEGRAAVKEGQSLACQKAKQKKNTNSPFLANLEIWAQ